MARYPVPLGGGLCLYVRSSKVSSKLAAQSFTVAILVPRGQKA